MNTDKYISKRAYEKALRLINEYELQQEKFSNTQTLLNKFLKRNDYIEYIGGSNSKYLVVGKKYRLCSEPYMTDGRIIVSIEAENCKRMRMPATYFK